MQGEDRVVTGGIANKLQASGVVPTGVKTRLHAKQAKPGSASEGKTKKER